MSQRTQLLDGVFLRCMRSEKYKTGCFSFNLVRPLCREEAAQNALLPAVLLRGTAQHPDIASISKHLDDLYGATVGTLVRRKGELQLIGFYADYIEDALVGEPVFRRMAGFLGELLFSPLTQENGFDEAAFEGEKQNLINDIRARINNKRSYAVSQMLRIMCSDEPYGIARNGDEEDLEGVTARSLYAHYQQLLRESYIEIFYMGAEDEQTVCDVFRSVLAPLGRGDLQRFRNGALREAPQLRTAQETMELSQSKLAIGMRSTYGTSLHRQAAMLTFNVVYGAGTNCKLFRKVREEQMLCYSVSSGYDKYKGIVIVTAGISADRYEAAKSEIFRQLDACVQGDFTAEELDTAKRQLISAIKTDMDSPSRLDDFYIGQAVTDGSATLQELLREVASVTADDVRAAAGSVQTDTIFLLRGAPTCSE